MGDHPNTCQPMVLPNTAFTHVDNIHTKHVSYIIGPDQLTHAPPVLHSGPHGGTEPDMDIDHSVQ